jgi:hypothetical protein
MVPTNLLGRARFLRGSAVFLLATFLSAATLMATAAVLVQILLFSTVAREHGERGIDAIASYRAPRSLGVQSR